MEPEELIDYLWSIKYIGVFPQGYSVLLVPLSTAYEEIRPYATTYAPNTLRTLLKLHEVHIFTSPEDWFKLKDPEAYAKQRRKRSYNH